MLDPLYQYCTDKEYAKDYIASVVGPGFTPETYAVLRSDADVDAFVFDGRACIIKPTHANGEVMFLREACDPIDTDRLKAWLRLNFYRRTREVNYRHLTPKIIVEELLKDDSGPSPRIKDYKVLMIAGSPVLVEVFDRAGKPVVTRYDADWNELAITTSGHPPGPPYPRPALLGDMLDMATRLAAPFPLVRVDLYASDKGIRVGELTFCPRGGKKRIFPESADFELGALFASH